MSFPHFPPRFAGPPLDQSYVNYSQRNGLSLVRPPPVANCNCSVCLAAGFIPRYGNAIGSACYSVTGGSSRQFSGWNGLNKNVVREISQSDPNYYWRPRPYNVHLSGPRVEMKAPIAPCSLEASAHSAFKEVRKLKAVVEEVEEEVADPPPSDVVVPAIFVDTQEPGEMFWVSDRCGVCNAPASGRHYNGTTCEGCKGFFRRIVINDVKYSCKTGKYNCLIQETNRRKCCKKCRYEKCLSIGMEREMCLPRSHVRRQLEEPSSSNGTAYVYTYASSSKPPNFQPQMLSAESLSPNQHNYNIPLTPASIPSPSNNMDASPIMNYLMSPVCFFK